MTIRIAQPNDLQAMVNLARRTPLAPLWTANQYERTLSEGSQKRIWVHSSDGIISGFLIANEVVHEWEIENVVVDMMQQRKNIATSLIQTLIHTATDSHGRCIHLEVRSLNLPASSLYRKMGFGIIGIRKDYYSNPQDDALLFRLELGDNIS